MKKRKYCLCCDIKLDPDEFNFCFECRDNLENDNGDPGDAGDLYDSGDR